MHDVAFPVCAGLQAQLKDPSVLLQKALASQLWTLVANSLKRRALGFSVFRVWLFFRLVFWSVLHWKTSVFRFCCPLWFPVFPFFSILFFGFLAKIKQVRFLLGSPCSQMLGYLYVSILQSAQRDSGFFEVYSCGRASCKSRLFPIVLYCYSIEDLCEFS